MGVVRLRFSYSTGARPSYLLREFGSRERSQVYFTNVQLVQFASGRVRFGERWGEQGGRGAACSNQRSERQNTSLHDEIVIPRSGMDRLRRQVRGVSIWVRSIRAASRSSRTATCDDPGSMSTSSDRRAKARSGSTIAHSTATSRSGAWSGRCRSEVWIRPLFRTALITYRSSALPFGFPSGARSQTASSFSRSSRKAGDSS